MLERKEEIVVFGTSKKQALDSVNIILMLRYWKYHNLKNNSQKMHSSSKATEELSNCKSSSSFVSDVFFIEMYLTLEYYIIIPIFWHRTLNSFVHLVKFTLETVLERDMRIKSLVTNAFNIVTHSLKFSMRSEKVLALQVHVFYYGFLTPYSMIYLILLCPCFNITFI